MLRPLLFGLGWAALAALPASAQTGRVVDASTGAPVSGAEIRWTPAGAAAARVLQAGPDGEFRVPASWRGGVDGPPGGATERGTPPADGVRSGAGGYSRLRVHALGYRPRTLTLREAARTSWRLTLQPDPLDLEGVVLSVAPSARRRAQVAVPVTELDAREIEAAGAPAADRLLDRIPGVQAVGGTPVGSTLMIRGIGDQRVLVLLDGQPVGGALIEDRDLGRLSLSEVERVEVVKGPLSSLYGSDAIGGVVNLITRAPPAGFRVDARTLAGAEGRMEAQATLSAGGDDVRYRFTGAWRQFDGVPGLASDENAFSRVWDGRSTLRWKLGEGLRLRTDASVVRERQRWPVGGGFNGFNDNLGITAWTELEAEAVGGVWTLRAFGQDYDHLYRSARGEAPISGGDDAPQRERLWRGALEYATRIGETRIDVGAEAARRTIRSPDKILEDRASDRQLEVYGQGAVELGTAIVSPGARWTFNDRWGNTLSPTLGIAWLADDALHLKASLGRGFRAPSFKELAWDFTNLGGGYAIRGSSELEPERSWNVSAGVGWAPVDGLRLGLEAYHNEIDGLIQLSFEGSTSEGLLIFSPRNVAEARTRGFEASAAYRRGPWRTQVEYALLDARSLEDDLPLNRRARHSGLARVGWSTGWLDGLTLDLTGRWTGDAPLVGTGPDGEPARVGTQEALLALDAQLTVEVGESLRLRLGGDNLLDRRPEGYSIAVGRRLRLGIEASDLF